MVTCLAGLPEVTAMAKPRLTEYLLKLATDPVALDEYRNADERGRDALMERAGLNPSQRKAVTSGDSQQIADEVVLELKTNAAVSYGGACLVHLQLQVALQPRTGK
jgi:hypothetical protein